MGSEKVEQLWQGLVDRQTSLLSELRSMSEAQRGFHPAPGSWSPLQVAHHLQIAEEGVLRGALKRRGSPEGGRRNAPSLRDRFAHLVVKVFLSLGIKVKAPAAVLEPGEEIALAELEARWGATHAELGALIASTSPEQLGHTLFRHAIAGPLDTVGGLEFLVLHFDHHRRQLARIRAHPGFAAASAPPAA